MITQEDLLTAMIDGKEVNYFDVGGMEDFPVGQGNPCLGGCRPDTSTCGERRYIRILPAESPCLPETRTYKSPCGF